jgi:hypothetical protein
MCVGRRLGFVAAALAVLPFVAAAAFALDEPGSPKMKFRPADMRRANSAVLRQADIGVSYFRVDPKGYGVPMIPRCSGYPGDRSNTTITGEAMSSFVGGTPVMGSRTLFFKTPADLDRYWALTVKRRFATCLAKAYASTRRSDVDARTILATQLPDFATGVERMAAFRTVTRLSTPQYPTWDWYQTYVFLREGRGLTIFRTAEADHPCVCYTVLARKLALHLIDAGHG